MTKVLVTGASGFIAKHIIRELLAQGYEVRGSIRSKKRQAELEALYPDAILEFAELDLSSDDGWDSALTGVDVLMHTASPFPSGEPDDRMGLIRPAVDGTKRALTAAHSAGVQRVILTSSCVAVYKDPAKEPKAQSTDQHWTDPDAAGVSAYEASKTLAERTAWELADQYGLALTTINPGVVFGPAMDGNYGTSLELVEQMLNGDFPAYPNMNLPIVDVRDVARMHVAAIGNDTTIGERFPANSGAMFMIDAGRVLAEAYPEKKLKVRKAPDFLIKVASRFDKQMASVSGNLGRNLDVDGTKAERVMGFNYIPSDKALLASAEFITSSS